MSVIKSETRTVQGQAQEMVLLQCDSGDNHQWWVKPTERVKLEGMFAGKHYCNSYILEMQKNNSSELPDELKSQFVKKY